MMANSPISVSYTHLDVYKRQIVLTHEHNLSPAVHRSGSGLLWETSEIPHFIHLTTIFYHFAPLSTTCMSIIVQILGNGKKFLRKSYKKIAKK